MKNIYSILLIILPLLFLTTSCDDWEELNTDPNKPIEVTPGLLLPSAQGAFAYGMGGDISRYAGIMTQHFAGTARQWSLYNGYDLSESDFDNIWRFSVYGGPLNDLQLLMQDAEATGSLHYAGVAKILTAMIMLNVTDMWGDVPYSQAFRGVDNFQPAYDSQQEIYATVHQLLDAGIADIGQASSVLSPGGDDLVYGGNLESWAKLANALHARAYIHTSHFNGGAAQQALNALANGLASNDDDAQVGFGTSPTEQNPFYQFNDQRGDIQYLGGTMDVLMGNLGDPRRDAYFVGDNGLMGDFFGSETAAVAFFTYAEQKFIEAEALMRSGGDPYDAFIAGIEASCNRVGIDGTAISDYIASVDPGRGNVTMDDIMTQKYIALFTQPESWTDWRRTGIPALSGNGGQDIPRRFLYPETERLYNGANVPSATLLSKVWWDQ